MDFSLSSFLGHLDKDQMAEPPKTDDQKIISNDVSIKSINFIVKEMKCSYNYYIINKLLFDYE